MFFFFNDPAPPEIYPLPLHDALPISPRPCGTPWGGWDEGGGAPEEGREAPVPARAARRFHAGRVPRAQAPAAGEPLLAGALRVDARPPGGARGLPAAPLPGRGERAHRGNPLRLPAPGLAAGRRGARVRERQELGLPRARQPGLSGDRGGSEPLPVCAPRSEEHTSELQSRLHLVCRLLLEKKK